MTRSWVVLSNSKQSGPFEPSAVLEKIQLGEFTYSDQIWKPGFNAWARIGDLQEFGALGFIEDETPTAEVEIDLNNVVRQVIMPADVVTPVEDEDQLDLVRLRRLGQPTSAIEGIVKGLQTLDAEGKPVDFIEDRPELIATPRLHYSIKKPSLTFRQMALIAAVFLLAIVGVYKRAQKPTKALVQSAVIAPAAETIADAIVESVQEPTIVTVPQSTAVQEQTQRVQQLALGLKIKFVSLEFSHKSLMGDRTAWGLVYTDWLTSTEVALFQNERWSESFDPSLKIHTDHLASLYTRMIEATVRWDKDEDVDTSELVAEISSLIEELSPPGAPMIERSVPETN